MKTDILSQADYEALAVVGLRKIGLDETQARALLAARWPMTGIEAISEAAARGRLLSTDDIGDWLRETFQSRTFPDGVPVDAESVVLNAALVNALLAWSVANNRGRVTFAGFVATDHPETVNRALKGEQAPWN